MSYETKCDACYTERALYFYVNFGYCKPCMTSLFDARMQA